jgi:hypothetical protein
MSGTTYYGANVDTELAEAHRTLITHISVDDRCQACGNPAPCWRRETAVSVFSRRYRLPRRTPGATLADPRSPVTWFGDR